METPGNQRTENGSQTANDCSASDGRDQNSQPLLPELSEALDFRSEGLGSNYGKLRSHRLTLTKELERSARTIAALTAELTARETQLSAILSSSGWRWVSRGSRIKRRYFMPLYEAVSGLFGNGFTGRSPLKKSAQSNGERVAGVLAVPEIRTLEDLHTSLTLLPTRQPKQLSALDARQLSESALQRADVVCFSIVDWNYTYQRPQQMMSQFAAHGHRVFHLKLNRILPSNEDSRFSLSELKNNLYEVTLAAAREPWINQEDIRGANAEELLASLDDLRRACGITDTIGYVMTPSWTSVALEAKRRWGWKIIYDCMDEWSGFSAVARTVIKAEARLARECDLLVVTARRLYDKWQFLDRKIVLARNAVDFDFYAERCRSNTLLAGVEHPVVGYCGAIAEWFDIDLIAYLAGERPNYTFVLLGRVEVDVSKLERLPNVQLLGRQPYETMPQYLNHFDVCLIPFQINAITRATDPVKVYEYLSAGRPVVSVALPELQPVGDLLYVALDRADFLVQLDKALDENDPRMIERRRNFARRNTWQERYKAITASLRDATTVIDTCETDAVLQHL